MPDGVDHPLAADASGTLVATGGEDGVVRLWEPNSGTLLRAYPSTGSGILDLGLTASASHAIVARRDGAIEVWDLAAGTVQYRMAREVTMATGAGFLPDGDHAAVAWADGLVGIWDLDDDTVRAFQDTHFGPWALDVSPDGSQVLTTGREIETAGLTIWDVAGGEVQFRGPTGLPSYQGRFGPAGERVAVGRHLGGPAMWSRTGGWVDHAVEIETPVLGLDWIAGGEILAVGSYDGRILFLDVEDLSILGELTLDNRNTMDLVRLGDGSRLAAVFSQGELLVFDLDLVEHIAATSPRQVGEDFEVATYPDSLLQMARASAVRRDWERAAGLYREARTAGLDVPAVDEARACTAAGRPVEAIDALNRITDGLPGETVAVWRAALEP